jgi:archaellum component FlaC
MSEKYIPKTQAEKVDFLMATDNRREDHIKELQKDVQLLTTNVSNLTTAIVGSSLNNNKGLVKLIEQIEIKVEKIKEENAMNKKDLDTAKFWGRGAAGVLFVSMGLLIKKIFQL